MVAVPAAAVAGVPAPTASVQPGRLSLAVDWRRLNAGWATCSTAPQLKPAVFVAVVVAAAAQIADCKPMTCPHHQAQSPK